MEQRDTPIPGIYGSVLQTLRHLVGGDAFSLYVLAGDENGKLDDVSQMSLAELAAATERQGPEWAELLDRDLDPETMVTEIDPDDGYQRDARIGFRLAEALQHGSEHRAQVCVALTSLGVEPPPIQMYHFGLETGVIVERWPDAAKR